MPFALRPPFKWRTRSQTLAWGGRTILMGILNVTPDSFSDGGQYVEVEQAITQALAMFDEGALVVDIGGESTRPGALPITATEELARIMPVLRGILRSRPRAVLSVDTYRAETACAALEAGAEIVNDVSGGLWDRDMLTLCAQTGCGVVLMHTRGHPGEWHRLPPLPSKEVMPLVLRDLEARTRAASDAGIAPEALVLDPGLGFGKSLEENFPILAEFAQLQSLNRPLLAGASRKGFLRRAVEQAETGGISPEALRDATAAANVAAVLAGAHILRVHDVAAARRGASVADHILAARAESEPE